MKRLVLVCALFALTGCAAIQETAKQEVTYYQLCADDPACEADAKAAQALVTSIVGAFFPSAAGASAVGSIWLFRWWFGRRKAKKAAQGAV